MEMRQLEIFRALAEELHFTRAAQRVHCVQSNVTTQIRALEEELGTRLFDRLAKRVILTEAGRRFLPYAEKVLATVTAAQAAVAQDATPCGCLCMGAPESVLNYRLPQILSRYRKLYPKVELTFLPYWDISIVQSIETGRMDMAVWMSDAVSHPSLKSLRLRSEKVLFVADRAHPLATAKKVEPHDLIGQTLLLTEAGCAYRKKLDQLLAVMNIRPGHLRNFPASKPSSIARRSAWAWRSCRKSWWPRKSRANSSSQFVGLVTPWTLPLMSFGTRTNGSLLPSKPSFPCFGKCCPILPPLLPLTRRLATPAAPPHN